MYTNSWHICEHQTSIPAYQRERSYATCVTDRYKFLAAAAMQVQRSAPVWLVSCFLQSNSRVWEVIGCPSWSFCELNALRPRQNGRHFTDDSFKYIFLNKNVWISIKILPNFVHKDLINNYPILVQVMAWRGAQVPRHYLNQWWLIYRRKYASLSLNESKLSLTTVWSRNGTAFNTKAWHGKRLRKSRY